MHLRRPTISPASSRWTHLDARPHHRGWHVLSPLWPMAHLGLARAAVLQGEVAKGRKAYEDFFLLWKDADVDLPVLIEVRREYEKLK